MATATKPLKSPRIDYRAMLLEKKAELVSQLRAKVESAAIPGGAGDEGIAREQYDTFVSLRIGSLAYQQLRLVNAALERLETGTYGTCL
ncbi:MAG: TraR/DksA family transcriptional regulator, partial [Rhodospirillales bacterium]